MPHASPSTRYTPSSFAFLSHCTYCYVLARQYQSARPLSIHRDCCCVHTPHFQFAPEHRDCCRGRTPQIQFSPDHQDCCRVHTPQFQFAPEHRSTFATSSFMFSMAATMLYCLEGMKMIRLSILAITILLIAIPQAWAQASAGDVCSGIDCQQGTCVPLSNTSYPSNILSPYLCKCTPGWKSVEGLLPSLPHLLTLPCTVPNCTLNLGCSGSPAAPLQSPPALEHISSPCSLPGICGKGDCEVTDTTKYPPMFKCNCHSGYANIFNLTAGYCLKDCEVGANCHALGITLGSSRSAGSHDASVESSLQITLAVVAASCLALFSHIVMV